MTLSNPATVGLWSLAGNVQTDCSHYFWLLQNMDKLLKQLQPTCLQEDQAEDQADTGEGGAERIVENTLGTLIKPCLKLTSSRHTVFNLGDSLSGTAPWGILEMYRALLVVRVIGDSARAGAKDVRYSVMCGLFYMAEDSPQSCKTYVGLIWHQCWLKPCPFSLAGPKKQSSKYRFMCGLFRR